MFKVLLITAVVATVYARPQEGHDHSQGHAYSSQSIVLHQAHETKHEPHHEHHHQEHEDYHKHEEYKKNEHHLHHEHHVDYYILLITAVVATVYARPQEGHGHGHGHAYSSQNIVLHQAHETKHEPHHEHHLQKHEEHHNYEEHNDNEHHGHHEHHVDYYAHPKYEFAYEVKDPHTHDFKHQHEHRDGDVVVGEYALHQPDGTIRIVKYHADKKTGFNADVKYEGHAEHIVPEHHHHH
ncbi:unnamed protein product [Arctia plantaginis]|uniref:Histidine-rich glycoprotein-like n=1 Tax=Arctia plantaginis TaxID=874455 RepID=A0A8S1ACR8_ARCPL|nr:unnamed protein product [Arctia plantaginis]